MDLLSWQPPNMDRGGATYEPAFDYERLNKQQRAVWEVVKHGRWMSLSDIARAAVAPEASTSARLRDLRKLGLTVDRKRAEGGLFLYKVRTE